MSELETNARDVKVSEDMIQATGVYQVLGATDKDEARKFARRYFKEKTNVKPSRVVVEEDMPDFGDGKTFMVMCADMSSGSLRESKCYRVNE